jgi:cytoskeletal protein CcmA (bactofilin family)
VFDKSKTKNGWLSTMKESEAGSFSIIAKDVTIAGNIAAGDDVQINGVVEGDVHCVNLTLGETGRVVGAITAENVVVAGTVDGPISATKVALVSTAQVSSDVSYQDLSIEPGARISGRLLWTQPNSLKLVASERAAE